VLISLGVLHKYVNINLPTNVPDRENESQEGANRARCRYTLKSKFNVRVHIHQEERVIWRMVQFLFAKGFLTTSKLANEELSSQSRTNPRGSPVSRYDPERRTASMGSWVSRGAGTGVSWGLHRHSRIL
jgi:hypothetical protein